jgi:molecular chaperone DnaK
MNRQVISKAVGIDLGTTNSAVAIMNTTDTDIVLHKDSRTRRETTPSCVWKDPRSQQKIVGSKAFQRIGTTPAPIRSIKRSMGKQVTVGLGDEQLSPEQVSALILSEMKQQIEEDVASFATESVMWIVDRAIVTVPAYFDQPQIEATRKAAELAGLQVLELLHEPTAAASYYCWQNQIQNGTFLVYDFGGGTFDVSILRCIEGAFEVLGISGNNRLGGDDIDAVLAEELRQRLLSEDYALELDIKNSAEDRHRFDKLKLLAEGVKKELSTADEFVLRSQSNLYDKEGVAVNIDMLFERYEVEQLMRPTIERTIPYCYQALELAQKKADITLADIDAIILAGGTTHIPLVRELVRQTFCADPATSGPRARCTEPVYKRVDTIVGLGAAIRAAAIGGQVSYNAERSVRVSFRGIGATAARQVNIGGRVEALTTDVDLTDGYIRLSIDASGFEDEQNLKREGAFGFTRVPLQPSAENLLTFEVFNGRDALIATASRSMSQSKDALRPTGGSSGTASISKALSLEVSRDGKPYRKELIKALTTLPASRDDVFYHPGNTQRLRLPLYQHKKIIKEIIIADLPLLPKGTPVHFTLNVDELASITIKGNVGDKTFETQIDPPAERKPPTVAEVQALDQAFQDALPTLLAGKRDHIQEQYKKARESYEAAAKKDELEQAVHDFEEMEELVASNAQTGGTLEPPRAVFDNLVVECINFNQFIAALFTQSGKGTQGYSSQEVSKGIDTQQRQGEHAIAAGDQASYADVLVALHAIRDHLALLYSRAVNSDDTRTESEKAADAIRSTLADAIEIDQLAAARTRKDLQNEIVLIKNQLNAAARDIQTNPLLVQHRANQAWVRLQQMKNVLAGAQGDTDDGSLVEDHTL